MYVIFHIRYLTYNLQHIKPNIGIVKNDMHLASYTLKTGKNYFCDQNEHADIGVIIKRAIFEIA